MDKQTKKTIEKMGIPSSKRQWLVDIMLSGNICSSMVVTATDEEKAKEAVFMKLRFKVKKAY